MSLRRFVLLALVVSSMVLAVVVIQAVREWQVSGHVMRVTQRTLQITAAAGELSLLVDEYLVDAHERPVQQWKILLRHTQHIFDTLADDEVAVDEVRHFRRDIEQADQLFDVLVKETTTTHLTELLVNRRARLARQLQLRMRALIIRANCLDVDTHELQQRLQLNQLVVNGTIGGAVAISMVVLYVFFFRSVIKPIQTLHAGTALVAQGKLVPVPVPRGVGELVDLTDSFNAMIAQLHESQLRLRHDTAFHAGERRLRDLADTLPHLVWATQTNGRVDYHNRRWEQVLAGRHLTGSSWLEHIHPDDRTQVSLHWSDALRGGKAFDSIFRLGRDQTWRWYSSRVAPLIDAAGNVVRWVGTASDIEDSKRVEDDLRQSHQRAEVLRQLGLDLAGEFNPERVSDRIVVAGKMLTGAECCVFHLCPAPPMDWRVFGAGPFVECSPGMMTGLERLPVESPEPIHIDDLAVGAADRVWPEPEANMTGSLLAVPVASHRARIRGWLVCTHSSRQRFTLAEEQVLKEVATLAAIVLDNAQHFIGERAAMRIATTRSTELARSNAELEQFAYVASHDMREPLRMISSYLSIIEDHYGSSLDARGRRFIRQASASSVRMQDLVHDMLECSLVGAHLGPLVTVDVRAAVDTAISHMVQEIEAAGATIEIGPLPMLPFRLTQLIQIFQNLVGNAVKFRTEQPPHIAISAVRDRAFWRFSVRDNGIGIEPKHHQRIFVMFQRLHGRDRYEGTGIGLSLCKKIIEIHGGEIGIEANPGGGSHFWFTVPANDGRGLESITPSGQFPAISSDL